MWILSLIRDGNVAEFEIQKLINRSQGALDGKIVLQLNRNRLSNQCLEKRIEKLNNEGQTF